MFKKANPVLVMRLAIMTLLIAYGSSVKRNGDGSVTSHSGPATMVERYNFSAPNSRLRNKRAYIDPEPRLYYSMPVQSDWATYLVSEHNKYRRLIPATDMHEIFWDDNLASKAQIHADRCLFAHSDDRINTGENIWAAPFPNYAGAVRLWFDEVYDVQCGCQNVFKECCGHYTQVVWADTNRVGCGVASCRSILNAPGHRYILVCHYTPVGNLIYVDETQYYGVPAFQWRRDNLQACSECPKDSTCNYGLCNAK